MSEPKGHWVWLDDETCECLMKAAEEVLDNAEAYPPPTRTMNQTWALWMCMVLCKGQPDAYILKSSEVLLEGLRGALTSEQFESATASRRLSSPGDWLSALPPWLAGKLGSPGPATKTSE